MNRVFQAMRRHDDVASRGGDLRQHLKRCRMSLPTCSTFEPSESGWAPVQLIDNALKAFICPSDRSGFLPANLLAFVDWCLAADEKTVIRDDKTAGST